ncbi:MAG: hypothetical protein IKZ86_15655 [Spirochaetaceae bacterium]|nr:hypothetical protein [Spirochaetaceae bacterium]
MKKLIKVSVAVLLMVAMVATAFAAPKKKDKDKGKKAAAPAAEPSYYVLDVVDACTEIKIVPNQYAEAGKTDFQAVADWTPLVKTNKPKKGDVIDVYLKIISPIDIDSLMMNIVDTSAAASYWTVLQEEKDWTLTDIKANVPKEAHFQGVLKNPMRGNLGIQLAYGKANKTGTTVKFERVKQSVTGAKPVEIRKTPKKFDFDISKDAAFVQIEAEYPWVNGVQDRQADPTCFQKIVDITKLFGDDLPIVGDEIHMKWKCSADKDVSKLLIRAVENTQVVNWWAEIDAAGTEGTLLGENIKAGATNTFDFTIKISQACKEGISLVVWYDVGDADGSVLLKYVK